MALGSMKYGNFLQGFMQGNQGNQSQFATASDPYADVKRWQGSSPEPAVQQNTVGNEPQQVYSPLPHRQPVQSPWAVGQQPGQYQPPPQETFKSSPFVDAPSMDKGMFGRSFFDPYTGQQITQDLYNQMMFKGKGKLGLNKENIQNTNEMVNWDISGMLDQMDAGTLSDSDRRKLDWLKTNNPEGLQSVMKQREVTAAYDRPPVPDTPAPGISPTGTNLDVTMGGGTFDQGDTYQPENKLYGGRRGINSWDNFKTDVANAFEMGERGDAGQYKSPIGPETLGQYQETLDYPGRDASFLDASNLAAKYSDAYRQSATKDVYGEPVGGYGGESSDFDYNTDYSGETTGALPQGMTLGNPPNKFGYGQQGGPPSQYSSPIGPKPKFTPSDADFSQEYEQYKSRIDAAQDPNSVMNQLQSNDPMNFIRNQWDKNLNQENLEGKTIPVGPIGDASFQSHLNQAEASPSNRFNLTPQDEEALVRTLLGEGRSGGVEGMTDIASVIMNRLATGKHGNTIEDVVKRPYQFSAWNAELPGFEADSNYNAMMGFQEGSPEWNQALEAINAAQQGDTVGGAMHYLTPAVADTTYWSKGVEPSISRGGHNFYTDIAL